MRRSLYRQQRLVIFADDMLLMWLCVRIMTIRLVNFVAAYVVDAIEDLDYFETT